MGMDGLSMANTGALKESTSADYTNRSEQAMQADRTNDAKQVQTMSTNPRIKEKEEEDSDDEEEEALPTFKQIVAEGFAESRVGGIVGMEVLYIGHLDHKEDIPPKAILHCLLQSPQMPGAPLCRGIGEHNNPVIL